MKVLTIVAHPRDDSLTQKVTAAFIDGLKEKGVEVELLDLYKSEFNPVLLQQDEPHWENTTITGYSDLVMKEIERVKSFDGLAFIFPVWWYSMPAIMKGYIDRVWNYNFAYGYDKLHYDRVMWIPLAGGNEASYIKHGYASMMEYYFNVALAGFTGIKHSKTAILYETLVEGNMSDAEIKQHYQQFIVDAKKLGHDYSTFK